MGDNAAIRVKMDMREESFGSVSAMREVTLEELQELRATANRCNGVTISGMRERYHALARLLALGHPLAGAARLLRMSYNNAWLVSKDPTFLEAVAEAREVVDKEVFSEHEHTLKIIEAVKQHSWSQILDRLEEAEETGEKLPLQRLAAIAAEASDRTGHGKTSTHINLNTSIASRLDRARSRSDSVRKPVAVIDVSPAQGASLQSRSFPGSVEPPALEHAARRREAQLSSAVGPPSRMRRP